MIIKSIDIVHSLSMRSPQAKPPGLLLTETHFLPLSVQNRYMESPMTDLALPMKLTKLYVHESQLMPGRLGIEPVGGVTTIPEEAVLHCV